MTQKGWAAIRGFEWLGHSDQGGRSDGTQVMVSDSYAYVAHPFSHGFSVIDCRDPRNPRTVDYVPCAARSWSLALQVSGDLLAVVEELDFFSLTDAQADHFARTTSRGGSGIDSRNPVYGEKGVEYNGGLRVYDISDRARPRAIGFCDVDGLGLHRAWWTGGRYLYASASLDGFSDHVMVVIDMREPTNPEVAGRYWLPGQWLAGGEEPHENDRVALHHGIVSGDVIYSCWRDAGFVLLALDDPSQPTLIGRVNWHPPFAGNTHTSVPLPSRELVVVADETAADYGDEQQKLTWVVDAREKTNPVPVATFPTPSDEDYSRKGGSMGPHNVWENRPEAFQSEETIFITYQAAGLRVFDLSDHYRPEEIGSFVSPPPARMVDSRPGIAPVIHASDMYVAADGRTYVIDYNAGLNILQWQGS